MEIIYRAVTDLKNWERNQQIRKISTDNWEKLLLSLRREGVKEPFKIGEDNTVYDGNNRLKGVYFLIAEGVVTAENGVDLQQIPCLVSNPQTEAQKIDLALTGNEQFASWDQDGLMNYMPEFENDLDLSLFNVDFNDSFSINDQVETEEQSKSKREPKEIECPNCNHKFYPK